MPRLPLALRPLWIFAYGLLLMQACTAAPEEQPMETDIKAYVSITLQLPFADAATRGSKEQITRSSANSVAGANDGDAYTGNNFDRKISSIRVVFYNSSNTVAQAFDANAHDVLGGSLNQSPIKLRAKQVERQPYRVFVIANPTAALQQATDIGQSLSKLNEVAQITLSDLVSPQGIVMTATRFVPTTDANFRLSPSEAETDAASLDVSLERTVAKLFIAPQAGGNIAAPNAAGTQAQMVNFSLDVLNQRTFWMRHSAPTLAGAGTISTPAPTTTETDATPRHLHYATDPNMSLLSGTDLQQFSVLAPQRGIISSGGWDDERGLFAPENTMNADAQHAQQTTQAVICLRYVPKQLPELATATDRTWANYKGALLSLTQLKAKLQAAITATDDDALQMPAGFKADAAKIRSAYPTLSATTPSFEQFNLKFYHNGENFYLHPLRHFSDALQPMPNAYGRYGLVRNHLYRLNVTRVDGPGTPTPQKPEDKPNDHATTLLSIKLQVQPWVVKPQNKLILK